MNQQAGPSIVLSVLIVGFFAVALFPRDPRRAGGPSGQGPIAGPMASRERPAHRAQSSQPRSEPIAGHAPDPAGNPVQTAEASRDDAPRRQVVPSTSSEPTAARPVLRKTSQSTTSPEPEGRPVRGAAALPARPPEAHQPSRPVTVVEAAETIADVALRVYGTTDQVDRLWRANRDALPRRDSPLVPGTLLRTPTIR